MSEATLYHLYWVEGKSLKAIANDFQLSPSTVMRRMIEYGIPRRRPGPTMKVKKIGNRWHKLCTGPLHREGEWILAVKFYRQRNGKPRSWCVYCESHRAPNSVPLVDYTDHLYGFVRVIVNRLGVQETARRLNISQQALWQLRFARRRKLKNQTARKILLLMAELNQTGEVRHRDSIKHGSYLRGHKEKVPTARNHFYRKDGDVDSDRTRQNRQSASALKNPSA